MSAKHLTLAEKSALLQAKRNAESQGTAQDAIRHRTELQAWYARMFAAGREGKPFNEPRPQPKD